MKQQTATSKAWLVVVLAVAMALLASCDSTPKAGGTLRLTMDLPRGFSAAGAKDFSIDPGKGNTVVATWEYKAIPSSASLAGAVSDWKELAKGGTGATVVGMGQGLWEIHVRGLNDQGTRLLQGSASGYLTAASSAMRVAVGIPTDEAAVGTLDLRATWDAAAVHDGILAVTYRSQDPVNGTYGQWTQAPAATQATKLAAGDDGATTAWDVHSGSHMVKVMLMDNGVALAGRVSAARVIDGAKSAQDIRMVVGQFIDMDLTVDDVSGAAVFGTLELGAQSYVQGDEVTVTWKLSEDSPDPDTWEWYLDGVHLADTSVGTYTFTPPKAGDLTISCTAYNDRAGSPGSAQVQVMVANAQPTVSRTLKVAPGQTTQFVAPPVMAPEGAPDGALYVVVGYTLAGAKDVAQVDFPYTNNTQAMQELEPVYVPVVEFAQTDAQGNVVGIEVPYMEMEGMGRMLDMDKMATMDNPLMETYKNIKHVALPDFDIIPAGLFLNCTALQSVVIHDATAEVGGAVFYGCKALANVTMGKGVQKIGDGVFAFCEGLKGNLVFPKGIKSIGIMTYFSCTGLTGSLEIPSSVTSIGTYGFGGCSGLTGDLVVPGSVTSIGTYGFGMCSGLNGNLVISQGVESIGYGAFAMCGGLTGSLVIPDSVTSISTGAFISCTSLASVSIPASVGSIGNMAFDGCTSLASISIGEGITTIEANAFSGCTGLTSVSIPASVATIGDGAFDGCTNLSITIDKPTDTITGSPWGLTGGATKVSWLDSLVVDAGETVYFAAPPVLPAGMACVGYKLGDDEVEFPFTNNKSYPVTLIAKNITFSELAQTDGQGNLVGIDVPYTEVEGMGRLPDMVVIEQMSNTLIKYENLKYVALPTLDEIPPGLFLGCTSLVSVVIPSGVRTIGDFAFFKSGLANTLTLPQSITSIGDGAFGECSKLKSAVLPQGLTHLGIFSFGNCESLTDELIIPSGVTYIGHQAFYNCPGLTGMLTIPSSVVSMGVYTFYCTGLTSVTILEGVTSIGNSAFGGCTSLTSITIPSSVTSINDDAFGECPALSVYINKPTDSITGSPWSLPGGIDKVFWDSTGPQ